MIPQIQLPTPFDCLWLSQGAAVPFFSGPDRSPAGRAAAVREAWKAWKGDPTDCFLLGPGTFEAGFTKDVLPGCTVRGLSRESTIWHGTWEIDARNGQPVGPGVALSNGTVLSDLSVIDEPPTYTRSDGVLYQEDGGAIGFMPTITSASAKVRRVQAAANDWCTYLWSDGSKPQNSLWIEDSELKFGRVGIAAEDSGLGQSVVVIRTRLVGDASLSKSVGATSDQATGGVLGAICRGGLARFIDCDFEIKGAALTGPSFAPRACAVTDHGGAGDVPAGNTRIELWGCRLKVDPNGATSWSDVDLSQQYVRDPLVIVGSHGSEPDRSLKRNWY